MIVPGVCDNPSRPKLKSAKKVDYSKLDIEPDEGNGDDDKYTPNADQTTKFDSKRFPNTQQIAMQKQHTITDDTTEHDKPKQGSLITPLQTKKDENELVGEASTSARKGTLSVKTVSLPKHVKPRSFKCATCEFIAHSEKERNNHHKESHGALKCAICGDSFDNLSGLHCHKYKHSDLKFICENCRNRFPFKIQLKEHHSKHLTGRG